MSGSLISRRETASVPQTSIAAQLTYSWKTPLTVIAYHLIWNAYGWWLPNDPRGSMSRTIRCDVIAELGAIHHGRKRVQPSSRDIREFYEHAAATLKHDLLTFDDGKRSMLAKCFADVIDREQYSCYACAIIPDHIHILIRKHKHLAEDMIHNLQEQSRLRFRESGPAPCDHPVWGGLGWKVFLDAPADIERTVDYIEQNPIKAHLPALIRRRIVGRTHICHVEGKALKQANQWLEEYRRVWEQNYKRLDALLHALKAGESDTRPQHSKGNHHDEQPHQQRLPAHHPAWRARNRHDSRV